MKKVLSYVLTFVMILSLLMYPNHEAYAANVSLGVNASSVNIGDTVKVSVTVPSNVSATIDLSFSNNLLSFVSATADVGTNGGIITMNVGKYSLAASNTVTVTFKANTSGTANINASVISAVDNDTAEETQLSGASTSIVIKNQVQEPDPSEDDPSEEPGDSEEQKSGDNSLASLKLSHGTLSPSFKYNVTKYTATVGYNVTSVVVSAKTTNAKATIESVTGNGTVALQVGENTIQIVVKAENGVKATYTIVVTRQAEGDAVDPGDSESESQSESENTPPSTDDILQWNGQVLTPAEDIPAQVIPADFQKITVVINSVEVPCLTFVNGNLKVLYLATPDNTVSLYVYDEAQQCVYPFVKLVSESGYVLVLRPDEVPAPENYKACTLSIEDKGVINAYQFIEQEEVEEDTTTTSWFAPETFYAAEPQYSDFYLIYGMNQAGETGWYVYDSVDGTFQRYLGSVHTPSIEIDSEVEENKTDVVSNEELEKELEAAKRMQLIILCVAVAIIAVLLIVIIAMVLKRRDDEDFDYDDEYDEEEYEEAESDYDKYAEYESVEKVNTTVVENAEAEENAEDETVEDDNEIEIEFYEMPQTEVQVEETEVTVKEDLEEEDDELEIEFFNMEDLLVKEVVSEVQEETKKEPVSEKTEMKEENQVLPLNFKIEEPVFVEDEDDDDLEFIELD